MAERLSLRSAASRLVRPARPSAAPSWDAPAPPPCPSGWSTGPPDFVGVGSQRCGTSWWFAVITAHPQVVPIPGNPKELHFFNRFCEGASTRTVSEDYHRYFPRPQGGFVGEWTPRYVHDFWVAPLLTQAAPDARLLVLVRDPVDRYWSGLSHELTKPVSPDPLVLASDAFSRGLYAQQLERLLQSFDRSQVLVLQYERCTGDPAPALRETHDFLGLEQSLVPPVAARRVNETRPGGAELTDDLRHALRDAYADDTRRLLRLFPDLDGDLWPNMKEVL